MSWRAVFLIFVGLAVVTNLVDRSTDNPKETTSAEPSADRIPTPGNADQEIVTPNTQPAAKEAQERKPKATTSETNYQREALEARECSSQGSRDDASAYRLTVIAELRDGLKDAESARFQNVYFSCGEKGVPVVCGQVNAKNALGGYTGFQRFVGTPGLITFEQQMQPGEMEQLWSPMCD